MHSQFIHLGSFGIKPRTGQPPWSCVEGVTAEGARVPQASGHIQQRNEAIVVYGVSPIEAGRQATEIAQFARQGKDRRLRCDGVVLIAGVVSYPIAKQVVQEDYAEADIYRHWRCETVAWLESRFGDHLVSVVEHTDEDHLHLHFYLVPKLLSGSRLDLDRFHPGREMKAAAAEAGASKKDQDAAYRRGMQFFQDDFHYEVSRFFGHDRFGPRRARVSCREHQMRKRMQAEQACQQEALDVDRADFERRRAKAHADIARDWQRLLAESNRITMLEHQIGAECARRQRAEAEVQELRVQLAALKGELSPKSI